MQAQPILLAERQLTELDVARLRKLTLARSAPQLEEILDAAEIVPGTQIDPAAITMYAQFELRDADTQACSVLSICYPQDAEPSCGFISVLSPLGSSLIGLRAGAEVGWETPAGPRRGVVTAVLFQPEASGDYLT